MKKILKDKCYPDVPKIKITTFEELIILQYN